MRSRRFALTIVLAVVCLLAFAAPAFAKDYHVATLAIGAQVQPDGSMRVAERREVAFNGDFHWVQWVLLKSGSNGIQLQGIDGPSGKPMIPAEGGSLSDVPASGTYILVDSPDSLTIKLGFSATDQTLPFTLRYNVLGAAKRYRDTAELNWKFVGTGTDVRTDRVHVEVVLPAGANKQDVKAWAHGPLNGNVTIGETPVEPGGGDRPVPSGVVTLDVTDLPPDTFVEGHILFPADALPKAPRIDQPRAAAVQAEEGKLADEANARRRAARAEVALAYAGGIVLPVLLFGAVLGLWLAFGREHKPTQFPGGYVRDIPGDYAPPLVGALWRMGEPDDADIGATLMDLSLKGVVTMRPVRIDVPHLLGAKQEETYELTVDRGKLAGTDPLEQSLVKFLFDDTMAADSFTIYGLRDHAKTHPQAFTSGLSAWKREVKEKADLLGWIEKSSRGAQAGAFAIAVLAIVASGWATFALGAPVLAIGLVPGIAAFALAFFVTRRSPEAVELYARYRGLRDYMRDFGRMQEKPPESVVLWEQYLVLAVVFGIADEVIAQMRVAVPQVVNDPAFQTAYWWVAPTAFGDHSSPVSGLSSGFASAVSAAHSAMSSSSGGGGGFSGGGGGGGGGGGFSAG
jgi:uncharacterized membrane protein